MQPDWQRFADACARRRDEGRPVRFWLRDDDATRPVPELKRLVALAEGAGIPLALAVIPERAEAALFTGLAGDVCVLQHGCDHRNRAPAGEKKCELPSAEPVAGALERLARARARLVRAAGSRMLDVLVPPWNRLSEALVPRLPDAGFTGLSRFGPRGALAPIPGLAELNTHVDIIDWHGSRGFAGEDAVLGRALRYIAFAPPDEAAQSDEAIGWLTHHACHDAAAWEFLARLFEISRQCAGVRWISAREFFGAARG